jgi:7-carboxy-7-deazaguanine synthase
MVSGYTVNEIFYSLQGEGVRAGTANVFVRFTGCNLACDMEENAKSPGGFRCDTEFTSGTKLELGELVEAIVAHKCPNVILTGGEPMLQVDEPLLAELHGAGIYVAIETNGTVEIPEDWIDSPDWVCCSPKTADHTLKIQTMNELKYVRHEGQGIPKPPASLNVEHYIISPASNAGVLDMKAIQWCIKLVKENPEWRLSMQQHLVWLVR